MKMLTALGLTLMLSVAPLPASSGTADDGDGTVVDPPIIRLGDVHDG